MKTLKTETAGRGKTAYSYIRFSTPDQSKGDSHRRQIDAGKKWCKENGYALSDERFFDEGKSGFKGQHLQAKGELKRFLDLVEKGVIKAGSVLLVENFDRISRLPPVESTTLFLNIINSGIGVVFTLSYDKRVITSDLLNKESHLLQMVLGECIRAHAESKRKSILVSQSKQEKRRRIENGEILKHNAVPKYFSWNAATKRYDHNDKTELVKGMVNDYLAGNSLYSIAGKLNRDGVKSMKTEGNWSPRSVKCILVNKILIGSYLSNRNFFKPIIEVDDFNQVQLLLNQNTHDRGKAADLINIFKGIVFCKCGERMNIISQSLNYRTKKKWKKVYRYLRCCSVAKGLGCAHKMSVPLDRIEQEFFINCLMADPRKLLGNTDDKAAKALRAAVVKRQQRINTLNKEIEKFIELSEGMDIPQLKDKLRKLNTELEGEKRELDALNMEVLKTETAPQEFEDIQTFLKDYDVAPREEDALYDTLFDALVKKVDGLLKDNALRMKLRTILPRIVGKVVVNGYDKTFEVFSHGGKSVYQSIDV